MFIEKKFFCVCEEEFSFKWEWFRKLGWRVAYIKNTIDLGYTKVLVIHKLPARLWRARAQQSAASSGPRLSRPSHLGPRFLLATFKRWFLWFYLKTQFSDSDNVYKRIFTRSYYESERCRMDHLHNAVLSWFVFVFVHIFCPYLGHAFLC